MAVIKRPRTIGTHDGSFHADEVTACALLIIFDLADPDGIVRTRDPAVLDKCEYVCDVGGVYDPDKKIFDHHQADYKGSLSSAGMILKYLLDTGRLSDPEYKFLNNSLILGVDAHDNGTEVQTPGVCTYSHLISNFAPIAHDAGPDEEYAGFMQALNFVIQHLRRLLERYRYIRSFKETISKAMQQGKEYLFFEDAMPWMDCFFELDGEHHPALFIVMPSGTHWKLRGIPPNSKERMKVRYPLPENWAGLLEKDLKKETSIPGAIFCHKGRFFSLWDTKEDALKALELTLNQRRKK